MHRRNFLALLAAPILFQNLNKSRKKNSDPQATSRFIYSQALRQAKSGSWNKLSIGLLMGHVGGLLVGTPYVGGTLEGDGPEICRVDLTGLDCVTFFESVLDIARVIKKGNSSWDDLRNEVTFTRYRKGVLSDYSSRLHYTADWIEDNVSKGVVKDISKDIGGDPFPIRVNFMSQNPKYYRPLRDDSTLITSMAGIERSLGTTTRYLVPRERIGSIESQLQTGDIVAIATSKDGLDYAHTGMIFMDGEIARFMHASSQKKKVVLDGSIGEYVNGVKSHTGISVVRPLEI
ncbi:MAG: DUF1460 domain-containing protein [Candidatus Kapabacteria bacterium]|nr:DUF1460 domain-containing protein [Candidatus Kapabacteria bacterium]